MLATIKAWGINKIGSTVTSTEGKLRSILFSQCYKQNIRNVYSKCEIITLKLKTLEMAFQ
jgi:hypothetical protein